MTSIRQALQDGRLRLPEPESATLETHLFLAQVLGVDRPYLLAHGERELTAAELSAYKALIERRALGEPYAYIVGKQPFYDLELWVSSAVLIPRSETELLVEDAIRYAQTHPTAQVADIGTGSGAIALTVAKHCPHVQVYAVDISPLALAVVETNIDHLGVTNCTLLRGDLATPLIENHIQVDILLANLPYIPSGDLPHLAVSRFEPHLALDGGADGLDLVRRLLQQIPLVCHPNALILLEIGAGQGATVVEMVHAQQLGQASILYDYAHHDRIVKIIRQAD